MPDATATRRTVLVVDDTEANRYVVTRWLRTEGFATLEAGTGEEGIAQALSARPDLVILDVHLPDMTGFEVLRRLREVPASAGIPVMHLSASYTSGDWRAHGLDAGADAYLTHPVEPREMMAVVRSLLRARAVDEARDATITREQEARVTAESSQERMARLLAITSELSVALTEDAVTRAVVTHARQALGALAAQVVLLEPDGRTLRRVQAEGMNGEAAAAWERYPLDTATPSADAVRSGEVIVVDSPAAMAERYPLGVAPARAMGIAAVAAHPLVVRNDAPIGALTFGFAAAHAPDSEDLAYIRAVAGQCAQALERARLYDAERVARREAERARGAAEDAAAVKAEFLATMSHELRTPLNAITGYVQLLELELAGPVTATQRDYLARLQASAMHLRGIVDDVLDLSKLDAGRMTVNCVRSMTGTVVAAAVSLTRLQAAARGVALLGDGAVSSDLAYVGDEDRVRQVLLNLLSNAVKFTEPGGTVRVTCTREPAGTPGAPGGNAAWVAVRVTDDGIGVEADRRSAIFEPFVQADSAKTRTRGGTGLGLTISRRLARLMGGDLAMTDAPPRGSVFTLWLPAAE